MTSGQSRGMGSPVPFGTLLRRLSDQREIHDLAEVSELPAAEVEAVLNGAVPGVAFLQKVAPMLRIRIPDLFVIAGVPVPEQFTPLDSKAGSLVPSLAQHAVDLPAESRRLLLEFAQSLPQRDRASPVPEMKAYEQYPPGFGGMLLRMFANRNLNLLGSAQALARLTAGRVWLSASTIWLMGRGRREITPGLLADMATVLGIPVEDLAALGEVDMSGVDTSVNPAMTDTAELIWEIRRLAAGQVQQVYNKSKSLHVLPTHSPKSGRSPTRAGNPCRGWALDAPQSSIR